MGLVPCVEEVLAWLLLLAMLMMVQGLLELDDNRVLLEPQSQRVDTPELETIGCSGA